DRCQPYARAVVIAGADLADLRVLVFPDPEPSPALAPDLARASPAHLVNHPSVRAAVPEPHDAFAAAATGSSTPIVALPLLDALPARAAGEITDRGSTNQRAVLRCPAPLVANLSANPPPRQVIVARG